jgi:hypothetical protein
MSAAIDAQRARQDESLLNFPSDVPLKAAQGAIVTATVNLIAGSATNGIFAGGVIAAMATLIEGVTRSIMQKLFVTHPYAARFIQLTLPRMLALSLAATIGISYHPTPFLIAWIAAEILNTDCFDKQEAATFVI